MCLGSLGSSCVPKKTWVETHSLVVYVNNTSFCTNIQLEHHRGPCRCECSLNTSSCHARQQFLPGSCSCQCLPSLAREKSVCSKSSVHVWDSDSCQCRCQHSNTCNQGEHLNTDNCKCQKTLLPLCEHRSLSSDSVYMINVIILFLGIIITSICMYWCMTKRRMAYPSHHMFLQGQSKSNSEEDVVIDACTFTLARGKIGQVRNQELGTPVRNN